MAQLFLPSQMQKVHCGYCGVHVKRSHLRNEHIPIFHPGQDYLEAQGERLEKLLAAQRAARLLKDEEDQKKKLQAANERRIKKNEEKKLKDAEQRRLILLKREEEDCLKKLEEQRKREKRMEEKKRKEDEQRQMLLLKREEEDRLKQLEEQREKEKKRLDAAEQTNLKHLTRLTASSTAVQINQEIDGSPKSGSKSDHSIRHHPQTTMSKIWNNEKHSVDAFSAPIGTRYSKTGSRKPTPRPAGVTLPNKGSYLVSLEKQWENVDKVQELLVAHDQTRRENITRQDAMPVAKVSQADKRVPTILRRKREAKSVNPTIIAQETDDSVESAGTTTTKHSGAAAIIPVKDGPVGWHGSKLVCEKSSQSKQSDQVRNNDGFTSTYVGCEPSETTTTLRHPKPAAASNRLTRGTFKINRAELLSDRETSQTKLVGPTSSFQSSEETTVGKDSVTFASSSGYKSLAKERFRNITQLDSLLDITPEFEYSAETNEMTCKTCRDVPGYRPIHYNVKSTDPRPAALKKFRDLKKKLIEHIDESKMHTGNFSDENFQEENFQVGKRVLRTIYGAIKRQESYQSIEHVLAERRADGIEMGNINHGRTFVSSMTEPFYEAVKKTVVHSMIEPLPGTGKPAPFTLVADKSTPCPGTLQTIGIVTPRKGTGEMHAVILGVKPVQHCSGAGTGKELVDTLQEFISPDQIRERIVGVAVDGAYHNTNVDWHLPKALGLMEQAKPIFACAWDGAHIIELAGKTSRGQKGREQVITVPWIKDTYDCITATKERCGNGKTWNTLQDEHVLDLTASRDSQGDDLQPDLQLPEKVKKFQSFSNTRFTTYTEKVLSSFRNNFRATALTLEKNNDRLLSKITEAPVILRSSALEDFYGEIGKTSIRLQSTRLYSWNNTEVMEGCVTNLNQMADNLEQCAYDPRLRNFQTAANEVQAAGTYMGIQLHPKNNAPAEANTIFATDLQDVRHEVATNMRSFTKNLSLRVEKATPAIYKLSREAFSLNRMEQRGPVVPAEFHEVAKLHKDAGYLPKDLSMEQLDVEYLNFHHTVMQDKNNLKTQGMTDRQKKLNMRAEEAIYSSMFVSESKTTDFRNVAHLLARTAAQSSCEAVTEGMGSVIENGLKGREQVSQETLSQEVFIKWNGPKSTNRCDPILELAGDIKFGGRDKWRFIKTSDRSRKTSKVLDKIEEEEDRFDHYCP